MRKVWVRFLFSLVVACALCALTATAQEVPRELSSINCEDTFSWMATSTTSPDDSACRYWRHTTDTTYDWETVYDPVTGAEYKLVSSPGRSHNSLTVGGPGHQFEVSNLTIMDLLMSWALELKRDGFIFQVSTNLGDSWAEITSLGVTMSDPYNYTMSTSTGLEVPPVGLRGVKANTGTKEQARIRLDFRNSSLVGQTIILRIYFVSDSSTAVEGVHLYSFSYRDAPLDNPTVDIYATPGFIIVEASQGGDPRVTGFTVKLNETVVPGPFPAEVAVTNGVAYTATAQNNDTFGNTSTSTSCTLAPEDTGELGMSLFLLSRSGNDVAGSWTRPADSFLVYWAHDPWVLSVPGGGTIIASGGPSTRAFYDVGALLRPGLECYLLVATASGKSEPVPEQVQTCSSTN